MDSVNYIDPTYRGPTLIRGYLKKLKSDHAYAKFLSKFTKRYFIADLNNYYFGYQDKETSSKLQKHSISELINIDPNPRITEICDWKFAFVVEFGKRIYTLYADSVSVHNEWCYALKACLKPFEKVRMGEMSVPQMISTAARNEEEVKQRHPSPEGFNTGEGIEGVGSDERIHKEYEFKEEYRQGSIYVSGEQLGSLAHSRAVQEIDEVNKDKQRIIEEITGPSFNKPDSNFQGPRRELYSEEAAKPENQKKPKENQSSNLGPKLEVIRSDYQQEVQQVPKVVRAKNYSDDEEISLVSAAKSGKRENDDLHGFIPIVQVREKPQNYKPEAKPEAITQVKPEITPASDNIIKGFRPTPAKTVDVSFKPSSILDMMSEMDNLGLENVEIRPINTIRGKILSDPKNTAKASSELFTDISEKPVFVEEKSRATESRPQMKEMKNREEPRSSNWETFEKPVAEKKSLTVKPVVKIALKPKYVEKPEIKADEDAVKASSAQVTKKPVTSNVKPKEKAVFKESNPQIKSQGKDMDWDDWDD